MAITEEYLSRSRLFRCLKSGPNGPLVDLYARRLLADGLAPHGMWRSLNLLSGLMSWASSSDLKLADLDEGLVGRYLRHRSGKQTLQPGDRAALKRLLSVLREAGAIAPAETPPLTPHEQIFQAFSDYLGKERGLAITSTVRHLPFIRLLLREVCPAGADDLSGINQGDVTRFIERHARDWSAESGRRCAGRYARF